MPSNRNEDVLKAMYDLALDTEQASNSRIQAARVFLSYEAPLEGEIETVDNLFTALQESADLISNQQALAQAVLLIMDDEPDREFWQASEIAEVANVDTTQDHSAAIFVGKMLSSFGMIRDRVWIGEEQMKRQVYGIPGDRDAFRETLLDYLIKLGG